VDAPPDGPVEVAVLIEGSAPGVKARAATLAGLLGPVIDGEPPWWGRLPWADGEVGIKLTAPLSGVPSLVTAARSAGVPIRGSAGTGVLSVAVPVSRPAAEVAGVVEALRAAATRAGGHAVVLTAPQEVRRIVDMWGPVGGLALMRRVKDQFDPGRRFAPGRFVGGI
jgi:glycolate oxidase FAD binding subunit